MSNILAVVLLQVAAKNNQKLRKYYHHQSQMKARHQKIDNRYHYR